MDSHHESRPTPPPHGEILLYQTADGRARVQCRFVDKTLWLSQALIAELYGVTVPTVSYHLKELFSSGELDQKVTVRYFLTVRQEVSREVERSIEHYNLDVILAVGYRVRSARGVQFRRWATDRLREYLVKGFTMDDERLKNPPAKGFEAPDYFDELLSRIRDIRTSERRIYLKVREIFSLAGDYDPKQEATTRFFQSIQNKLHYAATGMTAPEIVKRRADRALPNMGLTSWSGDAVRKKDVGIAKNYLTESEIEDLNRVVVMWLDFAEDQARRRKQVFMKDWESKLEDFLNLNDRPVLKSLGSVTRESADTHAELEYEEFAARRRELEEAEGERLLVNELESEAKRLEGRNSQI